DVLVEAEVADAVWLCFVLPGLVPPPPLWCPPLPLGGFGCVGVVCLVPSRVDSTVGTVLTMFGTLLTTVGTVLTTPVVVPTTAPVSPVTIGTTQVSRPWH